ncbi:MAG: hypothetical protein ACMUHY_05760, partial [Thermoplasmatota archaeon]
GDRAGAARTLRSIGSVHHALGDYPKALEVYEQALTESISGDPAFNSLTSMGLMVFTLLYMPCIATIGAIKQETGSWKWTLFSVGYSTLLAWLAAFLIYQGGRILGF